MLQTTVRYRVFLYARIFSVALPPPTELTRGVNIPRSLLLWAPAEESSREKKYMFNDIDFLLCLYDRFFFCAILK
jgi:hypothetical protein